MVEWINKTNKVWLITGASTGLGRSLAEEVIAAGGKVIATARNIEKVKDLQEKYPKQAHAARLDVVDGKSIQAAFQSGIEAFGRIDVVVNNAGFGSLASIEDASEELVRKQFDTNVFGLLRVTQAALPILRSQGSGYILQIASTVGRLAFPGIGIYSSTKFAVEGLSEALAQEVAPFGVKVIVVEPGAFLTEFMNNANKETLTETYMPIYSGLKQMMETTVFGDPGKAAKAMIHGVESGAPITKLALGVDAYEMITSKLQGDLESYQKMKDVTVSTAFDDPTKGKVKIPALV
jgi:NAD(P)-dependent dehydrogenase (short-subunit alcohol dehydrogenase family)